MNSPIGKNGIRIIFFNVKLSPFERNVSISFNDIPVAKGRIRKRKIRMEKKIGGNFRFLKDSSFLVRKKAMFIDAKSAPPARR
jgi:hypothetical protein